MTEYESVLAAALRLTIENRWRLIDELTETLPDDELPPLSAEWLAEINRRSDEIDRGDVALVPWPEVRRRLFDRVGLGESTDEDFSD